MALSKQQYAEGGVQDYSDYMERAKGEWPPEMTWDLDGAQVTEAEFQAALAEFEKTGKRPDWHTSAPSGV